jgi:transposase
MLQRDGRDESEAQAFTLSAPEAGGGSPPAKQADTGGRGRRYKQGPPRGQSMLLPPSVEDYVGEDNLVRAIAAYVDSLDLAALSFTHAAGGLGAGQPAYDRTDLLKLYLYGYLNRARSSRRLEAECRRNLEVIWLLNGLVPSVAASSSNSSKKPAKRSARAPIPTPGGCARTDKRSPATTSRAWWTASTSSSSPMRSPAPETPSVN